MEELFERFKLHDNYQVEIKFTFPLTPKQKLNAYDVDCYIFMPKALRINAGTYSNEEFYRDTCDYIRLKTPVFPLADLAAAEDRCAPLSGLTEAFRTMRETPTDSALALYTEKIKMFCSIMKSSLRDESALLLKRLQNDASAVSLPLTDFLRNANRALDSFRALERELTEFSEADPLRRLFSHADEFLSITINKYRYKLYLQLKSLKRPDADAASAELLKEIEQEIAYRSARLYPSVPSLTGDNEEIIYREGVLKKAMSSVLYLKTDTRKDGVLLENLIFGAAAGIAMTFATLIAYWTQSFVNGEFSLLFFASIILAYMGKDRIKELMRVYLYPKVRPYLYDYKTSISSEDGVEMGVMKESVLFQSDNKIPPEIRRMRNRSYLSALENDCFAEDVIVSRKRVKLRADLRSSNFHDFQINGVVDIMRLNVGTFLRRMANPHRPVYLPDGKGAVVRVDGKRVYHVNIVVAYGMEGRTRHYVRYRLVLSRNGIERISYLSSPEKALG